MNFSKELCQFIIKNSAFLEGGIYEAIEKPLFKVVNRRLENRLKTLGGWKGTYEFISGATDETIFAPAVWPEDKNGVWRAFYKLTA